MERFEQIMLVAVLLCLAAGLLLALIRAIRGPRIADRVIGINMTGSLTIAAISVLSVKLRQSWLLDVSLIYCMISFLAVVVLAKISIAVHDDKDKPSDGAETEETEADDDE